LPEICSIRIGVSCFCEGFNDKKDVQDRSDQVQVVEEARRKVFLNAISFDDYILEVEEVDIENDDHETQEICDFFLPIIIVVDSIACKARKEDD
jgi:hypothetical protein